MHVSVGISANAYQEMHISEGISGQANKRSQRRFAEQTYILSEWTRSDLLLLHLSFVEGKRRCILWPFEPVSSLVCIFHLVCFRDRPWAEHQALELLVLLGRP